MTLRERAARTAFVYGVPTVALYAVLHDLALAPHRKGRRATPNELRFGSLPAGLIGLSGASSPGSSPFCGWFDLRGGPVLVALPSDTVGGPVSATLLDLYADEVSLVPNGTARSDWAFLLTGPSWAPDAPTQLTSVLRCRTDLCLVVGRHGPQDHDGRVRALRPPVLVRAIDVQSASLPDPVRPVDVRCPPTVEFLTALDWMLPLMPVLPGEEELRAELEVIGVACGPDALDEAFAEDRRDGQLTEGLRAGFDDVRRRMAASSGTSLPGDRLDRAARVLRRLSGDSSVPVGGVTRWPAPSS